jgi:hypothetical protein
MELSTEDKISEPDEITRLYRELSTVVREVNKILDTEGPDSPLFKKFDGKAQAILKRIQQIESSCSSIIEV